MQASLDSSWAKIERAKEHRDVLDAYIAKTFSLKRNCPHVGIKFQPDSGEHVLFVNQMPDLRLPLLRCGAIIGDVCHNLRSALDHLAFQLAHRNKGGSVTNERRIQFPIEDNPATFKGRCTDPGRRGWIADLHPDDQAIIERFQVYNRLNEHLPTGGLRRPFRHTLGLLRDLSDKTSTDFSFLCFLAQIESEGRGLPQGRFS
jgi:hypothetical protein